MTKKLTRILVCSPLFIAISAAVPTADDNPAFVAASIKKSDPLSAAPANTCKGGPGTSDPGLLSCRNSALAVLILTAYNLQFHDLVAPDWMSLGGRLNGFDVDAKIPPGTDKEQYRLMLQRLLAERFHLAAHRETRQRPTYALKPGKQAPKLARSTAPPPPGPRSAMTLAGSHLRFSMHNSPISTFTGFLEVPLSGPVADETGLEGEYDLTLEFMPDERYAAFQYMQHNAAEDSSAPDIATAIQNQLGLKLETRKGSVEVLVIDHADKMPVAN